MAKILVVDDDPDILSVMEILLSMKGFKVEITQKGDNAIEKINSFKPDLVLLDVLISGQDGRVICKKIKEDKNLKHLPVLMLSAHPGASAGIKEYGADGFISKPFAIDFLLNEINSLLKHKKPHH